MVDGKPVTPRQVWIGSLVLVVCALLWSLNGPLIKLLLASKMPVITIACYRSLLGGLVFLPLSWRRLRRLGRVNRCWPIGSLIVFTLMTVSFVIATSQTAAANAIILQYTAPLWVFMLSPLLLRERFRARDCLLLAPAMAGIAIIFFGHATSDLPALLLGVVSGIGFGGVIITLRGLRNVDPLAVVTWNFLGSGLILAPAVLIWGTFRIVDAEQLLLVLGMGMLQMALPYLLFSWALRYVEAHQASLIVLLETVFNPILTYLAVNETVPTPTLLGGPLIVATVAGWMILSWRRTIQANVWERSRQ